MNKPQQLNSKVRVVVDTGYRAVISPHRLQDMATGTSQRPMINAVAIAVEKAAAGNCLSTRDQQKLESRPST